MVGILTNLRIPNGLRERVEYAVRTRVENEASFNRMTEIEEVMKRVDLRWEEGFINKDDYLEKRRQLKRELDALRPVDYDELAEAEDLLTHFKTYWDSCAEQVAPDEARKQLMNKVVERVFIHDRKVLALVLHGNFAVVLAQNETASTDVVNAVQTTLANEGIALHLDDCQHGSDGLRHRTCYLWASFKVDYRLVVEYWLQHILGDKRRSDTPPDRITSNNTSNLPLAQIEKVA